MKTFLQKKHPRLLSGSQLQCYRFQCGCGVILHILSNFIQQQYRGIKTTISDLKELF